jgi:voltage-gated potassium channel
VARGISSRLERSIQKAVARRRIFPYLAGATLVLGLVSALLIRLADPTNFPSYGVAVWWAIVTLATVGYGDVVPKTPLGRLVGSGVIVLGVTFLAFLTATVTSYFVSRQQEEAAERERERRAEREDQLVETLKKLDDRLSNIEAKLESRNG